jgi:hypothetical protein
MSGRFKMIDLSGKRFGLLTVTRQEGRWVSKSGKTDNITWLCRCDCGVEKHIRPQKLTDGSTISCGCWRKERGRKPRTAAGTAGKRNLFTSYRAKCKALKIPFNISYDYFVETTQKDCHYCGCAPSNKHTPRDRKIEATINGIYIYNGIDRVIPKEGYVIGNCVPCCASCNMAKSDMSYHEFMLLIERIYNYSVTSYREEYVLDGVYDPNAVSKQPGVAAIMKGLGIGA